MIENPWTDDRIAALRLLVGNGASFSQIAKTLKVSRSAAIGKALRLKIKVPTGLSRLARLPGRSKAAPCAKPAARGAPVRRPGLRRDPIPPPVPLNARNLRIGELRSFHCRYITNDDLSDATYCGCDTAEGTSWCAFHLERVRLPLPIEADIPLPPKLVSAGRKHDLRI